MRINRRASDRLRNGHVWVYVSDVLPGTDAAPGDAVPVEDEKGRFIGQAHYSSSSQIALRLLTRDRTPINREFLRARLLAAFEHRERLRPYTPPTDALRLVFSEADQLPGLIVDRYGEMLSVQILTQGMDQLEPVILEILQELCRPAGIVLRNDGAVRQKESLPREVRILGEVPEQCELWMNGFVWAADLRQGQKTGLFLDQRENYMAAQKYAHGRALDCFTSSGGFALHLVKVCSEIDAVDASEAAVARAAANAAANGISHINFHRADVFDFLAGSRRFETIVLDPPAFAKSKASLDKALAGYKEINQKALRLLSPGGVLVTCSCSQHVSETMFQEMLTAAALDAGQTLRILERRVQASDHPVLLTIPETLYLKCVIAEVM
ncbi:MAG: class I SAM-dependent rRNA methyltransferase [Acidobacteria bacterium]|nr:class I SAM-dependent rRNA methyltransferase [Acidobacteriota bacterium]